VAVDPIEGNEPHRSRPAGAIFGVGLAERDNVHDARPLHEKVVAAERAA